MCFFRGNDGFGLILQTICDTIEKNEIVIDRNEEQT